MISIKSEREIELLKKAGEVVGKTHHYMEQYIKPGITTKELDRLAEEYILSQGCTPSFKGLYGFPGSICISINEEVVHGIPGNRILQEGDIITLDIGNYKENRKRQLEILATKIGKEVAQTKQPVKLKPMSAYERLIIHEKLADWRDVYTGCFVCATSLPILVARISSCLLRFSL